MYVSTQINNGKRQIVSYELFYIHKLHEVIKIPAVYQHWIECKVNNKRVSTYRADIPRTLTAMITYWLTMPFVTGHCTSSDIAPCHSDS